MPPHNVQTRSRRPGKPILMRSVLSAQSHLAQTPRPETALPRIAQIFAAALLAAAPLIAAAQQTASLPAAAETTAHKPIHHHRRTATMLTAPATPAPAAQAIPATPKPPDWPVNDRPTEATVVWNSQGLRIDASNSSLGQILKDVATATGAKVEGLAQDQRIASQRVFGSYGPGSARDILIKLLDGTGFNLLLIGDQGQGTPREIVLSAKPTGAAPPVANGQPDANDDNDNADDQPQPQPQPQPPPNMNNGFAPGAVPRTPQQIMLEMQQRQQQLLQGNNPQ